MKILNLPKKMLPYPHCILVTSSHKIKLWEESATDEAVGMQRGLCSTGWKDHAPSGKIKFKLEMVQSITDAISTGGNGGMW